jgi:hypothetical protein
MSYSTKINDNLCPKACAAIRSLFAAAPHRTKIIFRGLTYQIIDGDIYYVGRGIPPTFEHAWTDADFGYTTSVEVQ